MVFVCVCVCFGADVLSSIDIYGLEDNLPDELVSSGSNWGEQLGGNKPPAQGPGPGNQHMNGEDPNVPNAVLQRQLQQQQLHHIMQQQQVHIFAVRSNNSRIRCSVSIKSLFFIQATGK